MFSMMGIYSKGSFIIVFLFVEGIEGRRGGGGGGGVKILLNNID